MGYLWDIYGTSMGHLYHCSDIVTNNQYLRAGQNWTYSGIGKAGTGMIQLERMKRLKLKPG